MSFHEIEGKTQQTDKEVRFKVTKALVKNCSIPA